MITIGNIASTDSKKCYYPEVPKSKGSFVVVAVVVVVVAVAVVSGAFFPAAWLSSSFIPDAANFWPFGLIPPLDGTIKMTQKTKQGMTIFERSIFF